MQRSQFSVAHLKMMSVQLEKPTVISPLKQSLSLPGPTKWITRITVFANLGCMTPESAPACDLTPIFVRYPSPRIISAVPLEPAPRIVRMDPSIFDPDAERNARAHAEIV